MTLSEKLLGTFKIENDQSKSQKLRNINNLINEIESEIYQLNFEGKFEIIEEG